MDDGLYDVVTGEFHPHPDGVDGSAVLLPPETGLAWDDGARFRVWEIATGEVRIDAPNDGVIRSRFDVRLWDDAVLDTERREAPSRSDIWRYPLDGSDPEPVYEAPDGVVPTVIGGSELLAYPEVPGDVVYKNWETDEAWVLMTDVASITGWTPDVHRSAVFEGQRPRFFFVQDQARTGLWVTLLPEPGS